MILVLRNVAMELSNVRKIRSYVMLILPNVTIKLSNVRKKNRGITKYDKITVICDVDIVQYEDGTVKCEKKIRKPPNVTKVLLNVMLKLQNVRWNH